MLIQDTRVNINISVPGVYCLGFNGATGKSYLYKLLQAASKLDTYVGKVLAITYDDRFDESYIKRLIDNFQGDIIMLDRFDLYQSPLLVESLKNKNCIVLLDLKNNKVWRRLNPKLARININRDILEVAKFEDVI